MSLKEVMKQDSPGVLWMMDEVAGSTTVTDYGTGAHSLTTVVSVTGAGPGISDTTFGRVFRSYDNTNGAAYARRSSISDGNSNPTTGTWTLWLWLETSGGGVYQCPTACFANHGSNGGNWAFEMDPTGSMAFYFVQQSTGNQWKQVNTPTLPTGRWMYLAIEYDDSSGFLSGFLDNVLIARNNTVLSGPRDTITARDIKVGGFSADFPEPWKGKIGPIGIFPTILGARKLVHFNEALGRSGRNTPLSRRRQGR